MKLHASHTLLLASLLLCGACALSEEAPDFDPSAGGPECGSPCGPCGLGLYDCASNSCDAAIIGLDERAICTGDAADVVFVDPSRGEGGDGTIEDPFSSVEDALRQIKSSYVLIAGSPDIEGPLTLVDGTNIIGGWTTAWRPDDTQRPRVITSTITQEHMIGVIARDLNLPTTLQNIDILTTDTAQGSNVGVWAFNTTDLTLTDVSITTGKGADGADGITDPNGQGKPGADASISQDDDRPGDTNIQDATKCQDTIGDGGSGGDGYTDDKVLPEVENSIMKFGPLVGRMAVVEQYPEYVGGDGTLKSQGTIVDVVLGGLPGAMGEAGLPGIPGETGTHAKQGGVSLSTGLWRTVAFASNGQDGGSGGGGSGAGGSAVLYDGDYYPNAGGSGGAGGCGGAGGGAGESGFPSIGILNISSSVSVENLVIIAGNGGDAGEGAPGSPGGSGGMGGLSSINDYLPEALPEPIYMGGDGGVGAQGGEGGSGFPGVSFGVYCRDSTWIFTGTLNIGLGSVGFNPADLDAESIKVAGCD